MITDIGIDLDGVCYPFSKAFYEYASSRLGRDDLSEPTTWEFYKDWGLASEEFEQWVVDGTKDANLFAQYPPEPSVKEIVNKFSAQNYRVHIVTNRPKEAQEQTQAWLKQWGIKYDTLMFTPNKPDIVDHVRNHYGDKFCDAFQIAMIEDSVDNFKALEAAGVLAFLYDQPWNRHHATKKRVVLMYNFFEVILKHNRNLAKRKVTA
jgi:uncharacterized HAD superfamily protein